MPKPNLTLLIITLAAVLVAVIALRDGCGAAADNENYIHTIDSLKRFMRSSLADYDKQHKSDSAHIASLSQDADTLRVRYNDIKQRATVQGRQLLALNEQVKQSIVKHDTAATIPLCDQLTHEIDSMAIVIWEGERRVDSLLFVNDDLKAVLTKANEKCNAQIELMRKVSSELAQNYEAQHQADAAQIRKEKKGKVIWAVVAVGIEKGVEGVVNLFKRK